MSKSPLLASLLALGLFVSTATAQGPTTASAKKKAKAKPAAAATAPDTQPTPTTVAPTTEPAPVETATAATATPDTAAPADTKKKHHGLFGKVKDVAGNKVVQSVAKTAACTMVPGGSAIASAIDAGSSHNVAGAASGAAGAATGTTCGMGGMGAMGNMGGMGGAMGGAAAMAAQQQAMANQQQAMMMAQQQQAMMMQQQAMSRMGQTNPAAGMNAATQLGMVPDENTAAACMGVSVAEYHLIVDPPAQPESKAHMKARGAAGKKIDQAKQQQCAVQAGNAMMGQVATAQAGVEQKIADSRAAGITEAPGKTIELANDPTAELRKGKTAVRNIDWVAGSPDLSEAGTAPFQEAMGKLAASLRETGGQYRIDIYMDQRYDETAVTMFGPPRLAEAQAALSSSGVSPAILLMGKAKRDKNPRLELVKVK